MSDQTYKSAILFVDADLETGMRNDIPLTVEKIEVI